MREVDRAARLEHRGERIARYRIAVALDGRERGDLGGVRPHEAATARKPGVTGSKRVPDGVVEQGRYFRSIVTLFITTSVTGRSCAPTRTLPIFLTTSIPSSTTPKMV